MEIIYKSNQETKRRGLGWKTECLIKREAQARDWVEDVCLEENKANINNWS